MSGIKISDLPAAEAALGAMQLEVNDAGTSRRVTADQIKTFSTTGLVADSRQVASGTGLTGGGDLSEDRTLALTGQALALHNLATNGLVARTGAGTVAGRTITAGTGISITNGSGVAGDPTVAAVALSEAQAIDPASTVFGVVSGQRLAQAVAANAPLEGWRPHNGTDGLIWSFAANGAVAAVTSPDFVDGFDYQFILDSVVTSTTISAIALRVNLFRETSNGYAGVMDLASGQSSNGISGSLVLENVRRVLRLHHLERSVLPNNTDGVSGSFSALRTPISHTTAQKLLRAQFTAASGNIQGTGAQIFMFRRKTGV